MSMTCRAVVCTTIAIASVVGCAAGAFQGGPKRSKIGKEAITEGADAKTRLTRIVVTGAKHECAATIDDYRITGKRGKKIAWLVEDLTSGCAPDETSPLENWHIELEFGSAWNNGKNRIVKIGRDEIEDVRVHPNAAVTTDPGGKPYEYKVYLVFSRFFGDDIRIEVIDPELDIEM